MEEIFGVISEMNDTAMHVEWNKTEERKQRLVTKFWKTCVTIPRQTCFSSSLRILLLLLLFMSISFVGFFLQSENIWCHRLESLPQSWSVNNGPSSISLLPISVSQSSPRRRDPHQVVKTEKKEVDRREKEKFLTLAFLGDSGRHADKVWHLVRREQTDVLVHLGDGDYSHNSSLWQNILNSQFPRDFPVIQLLGNHDMDTKSSFQPLGYLSESRKRLLVAGEALDRACEGVPGVQLVCNVKGVLVLQLGVGTVCDSSLDYETWLEETLSMHSQHSWKFCSWHKNRRLLHVGDKTDEGVSFPLVSGSQPLAS
jgi:hypothetical protein